MKQFIMSNFAEEEIINLKNAFEFFNINKIYTAINNFTDSEVDLFNVIPLLLHCNFQKLTGLKLPLDAPYGIYSFTPSKSHLNALKNLFSESTPIYPPSHRTIYSLAVVGSIGTVAQTDKSDLDYVLFVFKEELTNTQLSSLNEKLCIIELWAKRRFNIEVHLFVSDIYEFQKNSYGITDKEHIGSALGKLFKDEFYRTAIFVAGKRPLWWITPKDINENEVEDFIRQLLSTKALNVTEYNEYIDLGHVKNIGYEDFFGAILWQLNKAFDSPFKSLLKMGLLEYYLFTPDVKLLCELIKERLLRPQYTEYELDSYKILCEQVTTFYSDRGMKKEVLLIRCAFLLKIGIMPEEIDLILKSPVNKLTKRHQIAANILREWHWDNDDTDYMKCNFSDPHKNHYRYIGDINRFFLDIYIRLSDWLKKAGTDTAFISSEDMTVLGRKLFTYLERRDGKIPFIFNAHIHSEVLKEVSIINEKIDEDTKAWSLYDFYITGVTFDMLKSISKPIIQMHSILELLVWMIINHIWKPSSQLYFDSGSTPIEERDVKQILSELYDFFIEGNHFEPSREDYLSDKRIVKVLIIPNFGLDESPGQIERIDMILLTSWGEFEYKRMQPINAFKFTAEILLDLGRLHNPLFFKIVVLLSQNDPLLSTEFEHSVSKFKYLKDGIASSDKKSRLDIT